MAVLPLAERDTEKPCWGLPAAPEPTTGNLVQNSSLEQARTTGVLSEPVCFQQAGASQTSNVATWKLNTDPSLAHSGSNSETVNITNWNAGDRKLVITQRTSEVACLTAVTPGKTYTTWAWYNGSWAGYGNGPSKVSIATYYRNSSGAWIYWQGSSLYPSSASWNLASFTTAPLPAGATAISFGLALAGNGTLTTDDYAMVQNP